MNVAVERILPHLKDRSSLFLITAAAIAAGVIGGWLVSGYGALAAGAILAMVVGLAVVVVALHDSRKIRASSRYVLLGVASAAQFFVIIEPAPVDLLIVLIFGLLLLTGAWAGMTGTGFRWFMVLPVLFLVANLGSLTVSQNLSYSLFYLLITILMVLIAMAYYTISMGGERALQWILWAYVLGAGVSTAAVSALVVVSPAAGSRFLMFGTRLMGFFKDPNVFAPYLIVALAFALVLLSEAWEKRALMRQVLVAVMIVALLWGIVFAYSRAAWACMVLTVAVFWGLRVVDSPRNLLKTIALLLALVPVALLFQPEGLVSEDSLFAERMKIQAYDQDRFSTQGRSFALFKQSPLVGHGPGMTNEILNYATHNSYLRVLFENGVLGTVPFALLLIGAVILSLRASVSGSTVFYRRTAAAIAACLIGTLANSLVIDSIHWRHLWMLIGLGWATMGMVPYRLPLRSVRTRHAVVSDGAHEALWSPAPGRGIANMSDAP